MKKTLLLIIFCIVCLVDLTGCENGENKERKEDLNSNIANHVFHHEQELCVHCGAKSGTAPYIKSSITFKSDNTGTISEKQWILDEDDAVTKKYDFVYNIDSNKIIVETSEYQITFLYDANTKCISSSDYQKDAYFYNHGYASSDDNSYSFCIK